jgi:hypothetical protein
VIAHLVAPTTRRIVLTRAPLETYASFLRMRATGVHKLVEGEAAPPEALAAKVRFTPKSFGRWVEGHNRFMAMGHLIAALPESFVIDYALDALLGFVGSTARAAASASAFRKQYAGALEDGFENWGALAGLPAKEGPGAARRPAADPPRRDA